MRNRWLVLVFVALILQSGIFVVSTTAGIPERVASHFNAAGIADGYMSGEMFRVFTLAFVVGLPVLVTLLIGGLPHLFPNFINIPNRQYWLAPERQADTLGALTRHAMLFGIMLTLFGDVVHWLVLQANSRTPPHLSSESMIAALIVFASSMLIWTALLVKRFRNVS